MLDIGVTPWIAYLGGGKFSGDDWDNCRFDL